MEFSGEECDSESETTRSAVAVDVRVSDKEDTDAGMEMSVERPGRPDRPFPGQTSPVNMQLQGYRTSHPPPPVPQRIVYYRPRRPPSPSLLKKTLIRSAIRAQFNLDVETPIERMVVVEEWDVALACTTRRKVRVLQFQIPPVSSQKPSAHEGQPITDNPKTIEGIRQSVLLGMGCGPTPPDPIWDGSRIMTLSEVLGPNYGNDGTEIKPVTEASVDKIPNNYLCLNGEEQSHGLESNPFRMCCTDCENQMYGIAQETPPRQFHIRDESESASAKMEFGN